MIRWFAIALLIVVSSGLATEAAGRPFRGSTPIHVMLCRTSDAGAPPRDVNHYRNLLFNPGTGGLADWWHDISYGNFDNGGSQIHGWYVMGRTTAQYQALGRWDKVNACLDAARTAPSGAFTVPDGAIRYIVTFPSVDLFGWTGGAFLPFDFDVGAVAHEGGHGIGLDHSFSNDPTYRNADWAQIGEYDDPWDAMSWANSFRASTPFGDAPTGLIMPHLDRLGWLPRSRIVVHGASGAVEAIYTIAASNHPETSGALLVRVPYDPGDLFRYYTIEFRRRDHWSSGIPADTVLIHEVKRSRDGAGNPTGSQIAWLQRDLSRPDKAPAQTLNANGVTITVMGMSGNQATVRVRSAMSDRCLQGFVWREARPSDHVCVPVAERTDTRNENAQADARRQPGGGPFGPDTCRQGFVWREADDFDWVCVTPAIRQQTHDENAQAAARRQPGGGSFGPDTCRQGFVWREAFLNDHVCVPGASRTNARNDNAQAAARLAIP